ncbi:bifunctional cobalt-precorrin-7 (C(5))-methyltransferase/cobalt-precorrin-6B (C(15))-methyltransferase [Ferrovum myxofaciens]|jgi:precorrin-6Y C5,15-methyltransferase (decarboxylating)|uniref:Bifunctional cobalt-precorrin-7 (C(5))-methyltransferase/cobalt-precorrin-6B (C(15))-methyltransferase n=1 Tax=Ferrovum myxofaciens TaxID=416213 RepID=A0A859ABD3_9PROT|nr:bifunctional cobalt-precorrin-7 (C(5))-methyltransferase/cobalt-precorrin-6B (C(15))-methyltransferase [Ferrovum myxofaciens]NDU89040.1 bifunctional cobalt-precorrin-7 (C(5))-methyltransferase/cobalt-precorrin-6B (C(15))-methyltransferase [Ferrovum sp.]KXW58125.1 precorrin-6Y C(5,15)-methyltransferase [Ferrovum myxofaciens]QKE39468.1 MAG: bifunctional cobalt-precorrin-7 (C(5))-methyltransferase/cobalt-precorrin-6B (C(15))-methyltransferase [Ferrovum myxofaciens]QWY74745.1 MAG: bifunctional c
MVEPCLVIGVLDNGVEGLPPAVLKGVQEADLVIGGRRTLELFRTVIRDDAECRDLTGCLPQVPQWVVEAQQGHRRVAILASGDPLCHGVGGYLVEKLGRSSVLILPNLSLIQVACARLKQPWQGLRIASVHNRDAGEWSVGAGPEHGLHELLQVLVREKLVGVLTSPENTPGRIARMLLAEGVAGDFEMAVAECLLQDGECIHDWMDVTVVSQRGFAEPNVVLVRRCAVSRDALFGLEDARFDQRKPDKGLITKREVRAVSLARMALQRDSVVWDIGAGSGSVGLEAARLCTQGHVYAIEKNTEDGAIILRNRASLQVTNYTLVQGKAPAGLAEWPDPDAVFIGGSGGELRELIQICLARLSPGGHLVMNFATLENLGTALECLAASATVWDVTQLQAARSRPILEMHRLQAENPVWILCAEKPVSEAGGV